MDNHNKSIALFNESKIRRHWDEDNELWYFSVIDVISVLTESSVPKRYWTDLKRSLAKEGSEVYDQIVRLKMIASDGKKRETDVMNTENMFRLVQSIPSPKAEPFKLWLAKVGYERMEEIQDPELSIDRAMKTYLSKGYSKDWINQRLKTIEVRKELTEEWKDRGIEDSMEFAILTDEIIKAWSGKTVKEYKKHKDLKKHNLRDNMTNLELILNMLGEAATKEISKAKKPQSFSANKDVAQKGGGVAGKARENIEKELGKTVISSKSSKDLIGRKRELD